jgi:hypothetical protein
MSWKERALSLRDGLVRVPRDRYAEVLVLVVVALSLLVAWGVKAGAEARAVHIEMEALGASYGYNWIRSEVVPPEALKIVDPASGARFPTTITVRILEGGGTQEETARALDQARRAEKELYRPLAGGETELRGRSVYRNEFAYVHMSPDLLNPDLPVVVHGVDHVLSHGNKVYVITCVAAGEAFEKAMGDLERFLNSITIG